MKCEWGHEDCTWIDHEKPMKFRKKPIIIDAIQWSGDKRDWADIELFTQGIIVHDAGKNGISISTLEGDMLAMPGDWIIKGIKGEFYPCKPDIFEATYEPVLTLEVKMNSESNITPLDAAIKKLTPEYTSNVGTLPAFFEPLITSGWDAAIDEFVRRVHRTHIADQLNHITFDELLAVAAEMKNERSN